MNRADYNPRIDGERSYRVGLRGIRLQCIAAKQIKPDPNDPEEMEAARTGVFDPTKMRPLYE